MRETTGVCERYYDVCVRDVFLHVWARVCMSVYQSHQ